jgi:HK97 family phage portal protein
VGLNFRQRVFSYLFQKATGFPVWTGSTTDSLPGGWGSLELNGATPASRLAVVYGCARVLSQSIASLPWHVYTEDRRGVRTKAVDHPLYTILHDSPNAYMTSTEFRQALMLSYCLYGNAYAEIVKLGDRVVSLNPLRPERMVPMYKPPEYDTLVYRYSHFNGKSQDYLPEQILHIKNFSLDGLIGLSPIANYAIDHAYEAQNYGRTFFKNLGRPAVVLSSDQAKPISEESSKRMQSQWNDAFGGSNNAGKTAVMWGGMKVTTLTVPPDDAQYIETRKLSITEIAGMIYGVPANMLGHTDKTATYASAEQFDLQYAKHTIRPIAGLIEQAFNKRLFKSSSSTFCEMDMDALMRGDSAAQASYFATIASNGGMTRNEFRRKVNLPESSEPGADDLMVQSNMVPLRMAGTITATTQAPPSPPKELPENHIHVMTPMAEGQLDRLEKASAAFSVPKKKKITLIKTGDGTVLGADVEEQ